MTVFRVERTTHRVVTTGRENPRHPVPAGPAPPRGTRKVLAFAADAVMIVVLVAAGVFLGELLAGKSTRQVWADAGSSVLFPPVDLLMWLSPPVLFVLVYTLLISRGRSGGARLRKTD